jgi:hypothetical protein
MDNRSFFELYCQRTGVARSGFVTDLLKRTLYPHALPFLVLLRAANPNYFNPDLEFIEDISLMRSPTQFAHAVRHFLQHPRNGSFLRNQLRLRISVRRMVTVVNYVRSPNLPEDLMDLLRDDGTHHPFRHDPSGRRPPPPEDIDMGSAGPN